MVHIVPAAAISLALLACAGAALAQGQPSPAAAASGSRIRIDYEQPKAAELGTIRQALKRLGIGWRRAKRWITSPDPAYARKKKPATG